MNHVKELHKIQYYILLMPHEKSLDIDLDKCLTQ